MEQVDLKPKKKTPTRNRVSLTPKSLLKLEAWEKQINEELSQMVKLNKNDLVNFLIEMSSNKIPQSIIKRAYETKLTDVERIKWMLAQAESAQKDGREPQLDELYKKVKKTLKRSSKKSLTSKKSSLKNLDLSQNQEVKNDELQTEKHTNKD